MDFCIAGFPKCGTRTLIYLLQQHSDIYGYGTQPIYEIHGDKIYTLEKMPNKLTGFKHPGLLYEWNRKYVDYLVEQNPKIKFIIGIREPSDWIYTWYHYFLFRHPQQKQTISFMDIVSKDEKTIAFVNRKLGHFSHYIQYLLTKVPSEQICLYRVEDLRDDYKTTIRRILDFLNLSNLHIPLIHKNNHKKDYPSKEQFHKELDIAKEYYTQSQLELKQLIYDHDLERSKYVFKIRNVLSPDECLQLQQRVLEKLKDMDFRHHKKTTVISDPDIVKQFQQRILDIMPKYHHNNKLDMINPHVHYCHYETDGNFSIHRDFSIDPDTGHKQQNTTITTYKLLWYLNTPEKGGDTRFYNQYNNKKLIRTIETKQGDAVIFNIELPHDVSKITQGEKYVISFRIRYI